MPAMMRPKFKDKRAARAQKKKFAKPREQATCRFCREKTDELDYKDLAVLHKLVTAQGKMLSRKRSGNCAKHQRSARRAMKRARFIALMPFVT